jgi:protein-tyrosine-phosphatase
VIRALGAGRILALIDILMLCTGNTCRSPMAAAFLAARLREAGLDAHVHSAGMLFDGRPATDFGIEVMADRSIDTSGHRSRRMNAELVGKADLVVGMARKHVREAVAARHDAWTRAFTLKELVRLGEERGPRAPGQPLGEWLAVLHAGRRLPDLLGDSEADDVADPIGGPHRAYERTAAELEALTDRLARLIAGAPGVT